MNKFLKPIYVLYIVFSMIQSYLLAHSVFPSSHKLMTLTLVIIPTSPMCPTSYFQS